MFESMTGTAAANFRISGIQFHVWARSVNHRFCEVQLRCPGVFESTERLEQELEERTRRWIQRGRVEIEIEISGDGDSGGLRRLRLNRDLVREYRKICMEFGAPETLAMGDVFQLLRLPGVVELDQALPANFDRAGFLRRFDRVVEQLRKGRQQEGRAIAQILRGYLRGIEQANRRILKRYAGYKKEKLASIRRDLKLSPGSDLFKQAVDWLDKNDISEELARVGLHVGAIRDLIAGQGEDPGKQVEFYSQELLREVNTIAAKSRDFEIRQTVVEMKTKIENIKEQIRNIC